MVKTRIFKMFLIAISLSLILGCSSSEKYVGADCDTLYKDCISRCRHLDTSTAPDTDSPWPSTAGNCYLSCETQKRRCLLTNK